MTTLDRMLSYIRRQAPTGFDDKAESHAGKLITPKPTLAKPPTAAKP